MRVTVSKASHSEQHSSHPFWSMRGLASGLLAAGAALLMSCGGAPPPALVNAVIGPSGGTLTGPDGVQVVIPQGALSVATTISIARSAVGAPELPSGYPPAGNVYEFTPHGLIFALPVTIRMPVPSGASGTSVFMASPGEDWGQKDAYNNNGVAEFERNSFSWGYQGLGCAWNRNDPNLDISGCVERSGYASAGATPTAALTRNVVMLNAQPTLSPVPTAGSYTLNQATTVRLKLVYKAGENCGNNTVLIKRYELDANGPGTVGPAQILFNAGVTMTPGGGNPPFRAASGTTTFDVPFTSADSGKKYWFGLGHSCNKPGKPALMYGDGLVITVNTLTPPVVTNTVGGTVSGLTGTGLVLQNNGADNLAISADGAFTFATAASAGDPYNVTVLTQPAGQICTVANGSATVQGNIANVSVTCLATNSTLYSIGGYASYKNKGAVVLQNVSPAGTETITVNADNYFTFPTKILSGSPYSVTVLTPPTGQTCTVLYGNGTSSAGNWQMAAMQVECADIPPPKLVLVTNMGAATMSTYSADGTTGALTSKGMATTGLTPFAVALEPCSRYASVNGTTDFTNATPFAFVANATDNSVTSYTTSTAKGTATLVANSVVSVNNPYGIAIDPSCRRFAWVVDFIGSTVSTFIYSDTTGVLSAVGAPVATGANPYAIAVDMAGNYVYVANETGNSISVYSVDGLNGGNTGALTLVASTIGDAVLSPHSLVVDRSGKFIHAVSSVGNKVVTFGIDAATHALSVAGSANTGVNPEAIVVHPNGSFLYVANTGASSISIFSIDPTTGSLTAVGTQVVNGAGAAGLAIGLGGKTLYVANMNSSSVSVYSINTSTGTLTSLGAGLSTGPGPRGLAITP